VRNQDGELIIDPGYRWAKIQYLPRSPIGNDHEAGNQIARLCREIQQAESLHEYSGVIREFWFGTGCEPTNIGLIHRNEDGQWIGRAFTKTAWAREFVRAHIAVARFLKEVEKAGIQLEVQDEAGLWDTFDIDAFKERHHD